MTDALFSLAWSHIIEKSVGITGQPTTIARLSYSERPLFYLGQGYAGLFYTGDVVDLAVALALAAFFGTGEEVGDFFVEGDGLLRGDFVAFEGDFWVRVILLGEGQNGECYRK